MLIAFFLVFFFFLVVGAIPPQAMALNKGKPSQANVVAECCHHFYPLIEI